MFIIHIMLKADAKNITKKNSRFIVHADQVVGKELAISTSLAVRAADRTTDIFD